MSEETATSPATGPKHIDAIVAAWTRKVETLKRNDPDAFDGWALQKERANEIFERSPKRRAKVAAWLEARARGENPPLDLGPEFEEAERQACAEVSRRISDAQGVQLVRRRGITYVFSIRPQGDRGRSSRPATNGRARGSRRSSARRSSERSGDSGSSDSDPEPPPAARLCELCGRDISHKNADARHCSDKHRVYANRARDKADPDRVATRTIENGTSGRAAPCKCDPAGHLVDEGRCLLCGHDRREGPAVRVWRGLRSLRTVEGAIA